MSSISLLFVAFVFSMICSTVDTRGGNFATPKFVVTFEW
ncbi:hypothetical protein GLYMA_09G159551v4 [Glycine max]|nr:hypothetical protein GLYMA_09G159551v4 [Glycine max]KAH1043227.1 hypothetical protein GYH30_025196 [Glycine max]